MDMYDTESDDYKLGYTVGYTEALDSVKTFEAWFSKFDSEEKGFKDTDQIEELIHMLCHVVGNSPYLKDFAIDTLNENLFKYDSNRRIS